MRIETSVQGGCCCGRSDTEVSVWVRCPNPMNITKKMRRGVQYTANPKCIKACKEVIKSQDELDRFLYKHADLLDKL